AHHQVRMGIRVREGPGKGDLVWRRPNRQILQTVLKHPLYAGAYVYGRRQEDPRRRRTDGRPGGRAVVAPGAWLAFLPDHCPASISRAEYEGTVARLQANRARAESMGVPRQGPALLAGLVVCGRCGRRMLVRYRGAPPRPSYGCVWLQTNYGGSGCQHIT